MAGISPSNFSFVHAADLHLDTPFDGIHEVAPFVADALREASLSAFDAIVELACERDAAFLVVAGDVYDGAERGLRAQLRFRDGLAKLAARNIPSFVVHGNHDPVTTGWSAIGDSWPGLVTVFGTGPAEVVPVLRGGVQIATVQGVSYALRETTENLALRLKRPEEEGLHVGVLHCHVAGAASGYTEYSPCTIEDLRATRLDYLALGHIHQRRVLAEGSGPGDPWIVYPGNSQARSPRASEQDPKGAVVVHVEDGSVSQVEFVACDRVRFGYAECAIEDLDDFGTLEDRLEDIRFQELATADGRSVVLRVRLTGRGAIHPDLVRPGVIGDLLTRLRESPGNANQFCWWDGIEDATTPELDFDAVRGRGDFAADLLELADALLLKREEQREIAGELLAQVPRSLASRVDRVVNDDEQLNAMFERATAIALDELLAEHS